MSMLHFVNATFERSHQRILCALVVNSVCFTAKNYRWQKMICWCGEEIVSIASLFSLIVVICDDRNRLIFHFMGPQSNHVQNLLSRFHSIYLDGITGLFSLSTATEARLDLYRSEPTKLSISTRTNLRYQLEDWCQLWIIQFGTACENTILWTWVLLLITVHLCLLFIYSRIQN